MAKIAVVAGGEVSGFSESYDVYVGVDRGCLYLMDKGLPLAFAIGDFDSVSPEEFARIEAAAGVLIQAPAEKNDTDLEMALKCIFEEWPRETVTVFGAFGGRLDHMMSNLFLASAPALAPYMQQIELVDAQNHVRFYPAGRHKIEPFPEMDYVAFMPSDEGKLMIAGAKYPLDTGNYFFKKCYSSNEFIGEDIEITLDKGYVLVLYSKDKK